MARAQGLHIVQRRPPRETVGGAAVPLERRSEDEALLELARLARDLPDVDADEAWRRFGAAH